MLLNLYKQFYLHANVCVNRKRYKFFQNAKNKKKYRQKWSIRPERNGRKRILIIEETAFGCLKKAKKL